MTTWEDYKNYVRKSDPDMGLTIDEIEKKADIVSAIIDQRHCLKLSQQRLAELCGVPQSSIARIESGKSSPNLTTLLKILDRLGLSISITHT